MHGDWVVRLDIVQRPVSVTTEWRRRLHVGVSWTSVVDVSSRTYDNSTGHFVVTCKQTFFFSEFGTRFQRDAVKSSRSHGYEKGHGRRLLEWSVLLQLAWCCMSARLHNVPSRAFIERQWGDFHVGLYVSLVMAAIFFSFVFIYPFEQTLKCIGPIFCACSLSSWCTLYVRSHNKYIIYLSVRWVLATAVSPTTGSGQLLVSSAAAYSIYITWITVSLSLFFSFGSYICTVCVMC